MEYLALVALMAYFAVIARVLAAIEAPTITPRRRRHTRCNSTN